MSIELHRPFSIQEIAAAWALLLKDYLGSLNVAFLVRDDNENAGHVRTRRINVGLDPRQPVQWLIHQIKARLDAKDDAVELSSLKSCLHIGHAKRPDRVAGAADPALDDFLGSAGAFLDLRTVCLLSHDGMKADVSVLATSSTCSTHGASRISTQFADILSRLSSNMLDNTIISEVETTASIDLDQIWEWNSNCKTPPTEMTLTRFSRWALEQPKALAVHAWDGILTYAELDNLSARLASRLRTAGIRNGHIIPLCFDKSVWTPVAILGTLKAGAAFVVLPTDLPDGRMRSIAAILQSKCILALSSVEQEIQALQLSAKVILVGSDLFRDTGMDRSPSLAPYQAQPNDLFCLIFTSGTTGTPKAAMLTHAGYCALAHHLGSLEDIKPGTKLLNWAAYAWDVSIADNIVSLLCGSCLAVPSTWECKNDITKTIAHYEATHILTTPQVSRSIRPDEVPSLRVLALGGEVCTRDATKRWSGTQVKLMNMYSPAECSCVTVVQSDVMSAPSPSSIGRGFAPTWIVDPDNVNRLLPVGAIGELILEGPQVGLGYLNDAEGTASTWIEDPTWLTSGWKDRVPGRRGRLYRTGDLVQYQEGGNIDIRGRRDHQVKVRGQRIELADLGSHLQRLIPESIQWSTDVAKLASGSEMLLVFAVLPSSQEKTLQFERFQGLIESINDSLKIVLPPAMVPDAYVVIPEIPLAVTGKTDRKRIREIAAGLLPSQLFIPARISHGTNDSHDLPLVASEGDSADITGENRRSFDDTSSDSTQAIDGSGHDNGTPRTVVDTESSTSYERPSSSLNRSSNTVVGEPASKINVLRKICGEIFGIDHNSIQESDTFFGLGGESMRAMMLVSAASRVGLHLDMPMIFRHSSLLDLASKARQILPSSISLPRRFSLLPDRPSEATLTQFAAACQVTVEDIEDAYPCTPSQEGFITGQSQSNIPYTGSAILPLSKSIDLARLKLALGKVADAHSALRTRIVDVEPYGLVQIVLKTRASFSQKREPTHLYTYLRECDAQPIQLGTELWRWAVVRDHTNYLVLTIHHAVFDGWTSLRFTEDLLSAYHGIRLRPSLPFSSFVDYISQQACGGAHEYWAKRLSGAGTTAFFPPLTPFLRAERADSITSRTFAIPQNTTMPASLSCLLQAAWGLLISKLSGSKDVTFGMAVSGRNVSFPGIEELLGSTVSTVPIRTVFDAREKVREYLQRVQRDAIESMPFESYGLQNIRKINDNTRHATKFTSLLVIQLPEEMRLDNAMEWHGGGLKLQLDTLDQSLSAALSDYNEHSLMISIRSKGNCLTIDASHDSKIVSPERVDLLLGQLIHTTAQLGQTENLDAPVLALSLAGADDLELVWGWNEFCAPTDSRCIHDLALNTVAAQSRDQAVCAWDGNLTYQDVGSLSHRLALELIGRGVGRGSFVPIFMNKSKLTAVAMLAVMRCGAAFFAIDARKQPQARLHTMLHELKASEIITIQHLEEQAKAICDSVVVMDKPQPASSAELKLPDVEPSAVAFVVFTSGSTGIPKAIPITHENFCSTVVPHANQLKLSKTVRIYDYASYSFDIAVHNTLMSLIFGGCLCVPSEEDRYNDIEGSFATLGANWMNITPSVARLLDPQRLSNLETLVLSGEAVGEDVIHSFAGYADIINAYGPAEAQICTIQPGLRPSSDPRKIGRGAGCCTWVVDLYSNELSPVGAIGELLIEGPIVSPGYLNSATEAFISDPSWLINSALIKRGQQNRLYRTGDLASYTMDGTLLYHGRLNDQIKVNGQRLEPSEVEHHLSNLMPSVHGVIVDAIEIQGASRLCAFVQQSHSPIPLEPNPVVFHPSPHVIDELSRSLPAFMIPSVFLSVLHIPLGRTGKADRRLLRDCTAKLVPNDLLPNMDAHLLSEPKQLSEKQKRMCQAWAKVLRIGEAAIDLNSDFFKLGGDSVSAMRLVKVARTHGLHVLMSDILVLTKLEQLCCAAVSTETMTVNVPLDITQQETVKPYALVPAEAKAVLRTTAAASCKLRADQILDIYPCTPFQEAVLAQTLVDPQAYIQQTELKIPSSLDIGGVLAAWEAVIMSTPILRTRIAQTDDGPFIQVVTRSGADWQYFSSLEDYENTESHVMGLGDRLSHFSVLPKDCHQDHQYRIIWTIHHALYDSWTIDLILQKVSETYHNKVSSATWPSYNVFVRFLGDQRAKSRQWWQSELSGASNAAIYPKVTTDVVFGTADKTRSKQIVLPSSSIAGYSPAVLLRTAWSILMARLTGGDSVVFGEVRLGRDAELHGLHEICGPTIAAVPVLVPLDWNQTAVELLDRVRQISSRVHGFEHFGLQNISQISDDAKAACNFQSIIVVQDTDASSHSPSIFETGNQLDEIRNFNSWSLMLVFNKNSNVIDAEAVFKEHAISTQQVDMLLLQLRSILHSLCATIPSTLLYELNEANNEDIEAIWEWNACLPGTVDEFVHDLISKQASARPDHLAIAAHDGEMTYSQLDMFSSNLATKLLDLGVSGDDLVPICSEKSLWVACAMLGVVKAGAAFTLMDVTYPEERLQTICILAKARIAITSFAQRDLAQRLVPEVLLINSEACTTPGVSSLDPINGTDPGRAMYVCFTSGSTGVPKGVIVSHRNLASASVHQTRDLGFDYGDRVYDFSSHGFDACIWHLYLGLVAGCTVCIPSEEARMNTLAADITAFDATKLFLTPSVARTLDPTELPHVQRLFLGGEAITPLDVSMWRDRVDLWCAYGPTELTPLCLFTSLSGPDTASTIGKGSGVLPWICDPMDYNKLMSVGAVGEMVVEGPLVTQGYHGQPEKSAQVFIQDPQFLLQGSKSRPGRHGRLYRTGDLVRYTADGSIQYLGRCDTQVKLRGQRVDFGEVEYHLKRVLPSSTTSICEVVTNPTGRPALVAFYTSEHDWPPEPASIRAQLGKKLPPYMIPEAFLAITQVPKAPSGKTDRMRLRQIGSEMLELRKAEMEDYKLGRVEGPLTGMETALARLWSIVLDTSDLRLGLESDFFDCGADSISAIKLSNLARKHDLTLLFKDIMKVPKLSAMASMMQPLSYSSSLTEYFSLIPSGRKSGLIRDAARICGVSEQEITDIYPCTPLQMELFTITMIQPSAYITRSVFEVPCELNLDRLLAAWDTVVALNPILRTRFIEADDMGLLQVVHAQNNQWTTYPSLDAYAKDPVLIEQGRPLSWLSVIAADEALSGNAKIAWTVHHAVYDGWSVALIEDQLRRAYRGLQIQDPPEFRLLVEYVTSMNQKKATDFWRMHLDAPGSQAIFPQLPSKSYRVKPTKRHQQMLEIARPHNFSLQTLIHVSWGMMVSRLTETDDVIFAATLTGRLPIIPGIEQVIGPTITPVPIRIQFKGGQTISQLVSSLEHYISSMEPYQHIGTSTIENINDDTKAACKFQTLIVVNPDNFGSQASGEIQVSSYEAQGRDEVFHTFGLVMFFTPWKNGLVKVETIFDPHLLSERDVQRQSGRIAAVINAFNNERPETLVADVECIGKEDREDIWAWNREAAPVSSYLLHEIILSSVRRQPSSKVAIDAWDCKIYYCDVEERTAKLTSYIRELGIGRSSVVPIISRKSGLVPLAALAVLQAGAAFLPLDGNQPVRRLHAIINKVKAKVLIADKDVLETINTLDVEVLILQECLESSAECVNYSGKATVRPALEDLACVLMTSGSTGKPKGVLLSHRAFSSAISNQAAQSGFTEDTRAFDFASYGFDVSWNMIFKCLALGATICVPSEDERKNDITGAINQYAATFTELTASVARLIKPSQLSTLRTLILSGEFVDFREFEHWNAKVRLVVCYGPSECTSVSTVNPGLSDDFRDEGIGKASSCSVWLVNPNNHEQLMPVGAIGEILIEGPNVGQGYLDDAPLTRERFVSHLPWLQGQQERYTKLAFKSGDLARYDANGNLHFISRKDLQVKVRGQRVELEECEFHIKSLMEGAIDAVSCSITGAMADSKLVAFLSTANEALLKECEIAVPTERASTKVQQMDSLLRDILPSYMLPSLYHFVSTIPRTINGKADRKKLERLSEHASASECYYGHVKTEVSHWIPRTPTELQIYDLWLEILGTSSQQAAANDDFFSLGGDSISAMRFVSRARSMGYGVSVSTLYSHPRLEDIARIINPQDDEEKPTLQPVAQTGTQSAVITGNTTPGLLSCSRDALTLRIEIVRKLELQDSSSIEDVYPCSPLQKSMLAATVQDPQAFLSIRLYQTTAEIDEHRLKAAWACISSRNRILRTRMVDLDDVGIHQVILHNDFHWKTYQDLQQFLLDISRAEMGANKLLTHWAFIRGPHGNQLAWCIHHSLYDGWMLQMIEKEVEASYLGQALPAPSPDMKTFVRYITGLDKGASLDFWKEELKDGANATVYPALGSHLKPDPSAYLEDELHIDLTRLPSGTTLTSILYSTWALLTSSMTGSAIQSFGAILTGRSIPIDGIDTMMGPAITTTPVLIHLDPTQPVGLLLQDVRESRIRSMPHEHCGIAAIRKIHESAMRACEFQTVLVIQPPKNRADIDEETRQVVMSPVDETKIDGFPNQHAVLNQYALMIEVLPDVNKTTMRASFDDSIIPVPSMRRLLHQWAHMIHQFIKAISSNPSQPLGTIKLASDDDIDEIWTWNQHVPESATTVFVHDAISGFAEHTPNSLAIDSWDGKLTYSELLSTATVLADYLIASGVGPGSYVPLLFPKSLYANVSMLAVMKSGAAFVPLDWKHPEGRLRASMHILNAKIILCSQETRDLASRLAPRAVLVDQDLNFYAETGNIHQAHEADVQSRIQRSLRASDPVYAVFTSGSTGTAKAVLISHANLASAIHHQATAEGMFISPRVRSLDSSSYSFDACIFNFVYTTGRGGCLCVPSENVLQGDIGSFMAQYRVNWAQLVPSVCRTIDPEAVPDLETLILTGEPITRRDAEIWSSQVRLLNVYGPTECTILATVSLPIEDSHKASNIGYARGCNIWLTQIEDPDKLVPCGAIGEILIEGPIIGAGYLGNDDKYPLVKDPKFLLSGSKSVTGRCGSVYRTGDQGRCLPDGSIEFLGRIGSEVKLRGQRVNLSEVEDVTRDSATVYITFVAEIVNIGKRQAEAPRQMLVLFAAGLNGHEAREKVRDLVPSFDKAFKAALPSYLRPEAFVVIPEIPRTSSGKIDRRRLRLIGGETRFDQLIWISSSQIPQEFIASVTREERELARLWAQVLGISADSISRNDDFFIRGADSISVMRLVTIAQQNKWFLRGIDVFQNPVLSQLAEKMSATTQTESEKLPYQPYKLLPASVSLDTFTKVFVPFEFGISADQIEDVLPANGFQVDYMHNEEEPLGLQYAYLDISPRVDWQQLVEATRAIVQMFQCLRARFVVHDGMYYQVILREAPFSVETVSTDEQMTTFCNKFCYTDCREAQVNDTYTKLSLISTKDGKRRVILRMSHMQYDGWSQLRIVHDIARMYNRQPIGKSLEWTELLWHRHLSNRQSRDYWSSTLTDAPTPTPPLLFKPGGTHVRTLRTYAMTNFQNASDNRRTRPTVIANVAWTLVLQSVMGGKEFVFGNVTTGRNGTLPELDSVVGPCVNMLPFRLALPSETDTRSRKNFLKSLVEISANHVDGRASHEGLDWDYMVQECTKWPVGSRYTSAVHFRNMAFYPELTLGEDALTVGWYELVAKPEWTTVLIYPENEVLRFWLIANPEHIGNEGASELLQMLGQYMKEIVDAL